MSTRDEDFTERISEAFTCSVCLEDFSDPRNLHCGHVFCRKCLETLHAKDNKTKVTCPNCRSVTKVKQIEELGRPTIVTDIQEKLYESLAKQNFCDGCIQQDTPALNFCHDCRKRFCGACAQRHDAHPKLASHACVPLDHVAFCDVHKRELLDAFCKDCDRVICTLCIMGEHLAHVTCELGEVVTSTKRELEKVLAQPTTLTTATAKSVSDIREDIKVNQVEFKDAVRALKLEINILHECLTNVERQFVRSSDAQLARLKEKIDVMTRKKALVERARELSKMADSDAAMLISARRVIAESARSPHVPDFEVVVPVAPPTFRELALRLQSINGKFGYREEKYLVRAGVATPGGKENNVPDVIIVDTPSPAVMVTTRVSKRAKSPATRDTRGKKNKAKTNE